MATGKQTLVTQDYNLPSISLQEITKVIFWCSSGGYPHHWVTSYEFSNIVKQDNISYSGVSLNMYQINMSLHGSLDYGARPENMLYSSHAGFKFILDFKTEVTVQSLSHLIFSNGLHLYKYDPSGSGCMFWHLELLKRFVGEGWVAQTDFMRLEASLEAYAKEQGREAVPYPPIQGQFYQIGDEIEDDW